MCLAHSAGIARRKCLARSRSRSYRKDTVRHTCTHRRRANSTIHDSLLCVCCSLCAVRDLLRVHAVHLQQAVHRHVPRRRCARPHAELLPIHAQSVCDACGHQQTAQQRRDSHGSDWRAAAVTDVPTGCGGCVWIPFVSDSVWQFPYGGRSATPQWHSKSTARIRA